MGVNTFLRTISKNTLRQLISGGTARDIITSRVEGYHQTCILIFGECYLSHKAKYDLSRPRNKEKFG